MFKLGIFIKTPKGERLHKWLPDRFTTFAAADKACEEKNRHLGVPTTGEVANGHKFAMFDNC